MIKTIIIIVTAVVLSIIAAFSFAGALEKASSTRAGRNPDRKRRSLELGLQGRAILFAIFAIVMLLLAWMSHVPLLSTIVCLILAIGLVLGNLYVKKNGINSLKGFLCLWIGNLIGSLAYANFRSDDGRWNKVYIILQVICLVLLLVGSLIGNIISYFLVYKDEEDDADVVTEDVDNSSEEESEDEASENNEDETDDEDEDDEPTVWDKLKDKLKKINWLLVLDIVTLIAIIAFFVFIGYYFEAKYDLFWPFNS
jgi:hypothetical protein